MRLRIGSALAVFAVLAIRMPCVTHAGVVTIGSTTPVVDGLDAANLVWTDTQAEKVWSDAVNPGQSFTTGPKGGTLKAFSMQLNSTSGSLTKTRYYSVRVITIASPSSTSTVVLETGHTHLSTWISGDWMTWTLNTPIALLPNSHYGIDIEHTSGGDWAQGIPYLRYNRQSAFADGYYYKKADGNPTTITATTGNDRVFHIDIDAPPPAGTVMVIK